MFLSHDTLEDTTITNHPLRHPERLVINDRQFRQIIYDVEIIDFLLSLYSNISSSNIRTNLILSPIMQDILNFIITKTTLFLNIY